MLSQSSKPSKLIPSKPHSNKPKPPRRRKTARNKNPNNPQNPKKPPQPLTFPPRHRHIHPKQPTDQVQRHEDRRQQRDLAEDLVGAVALADVVDAELGEVVGVAAREHLFEVAEVRHHGHDVVLHVAEIEPDFAARGDGVGLVAAFRKALDDVGFPAEETHEGHDFFSAVADLAEQRGEVVGAGDEDLVFDGFGFHFDGVDGGAEGVDDVVDHGVADPVGREHHVVSEFPDALADVGGVRAGVVGYC